MRDLIERLKRASKTLLEMNQATIKADEWRRLVAKREGVELALSYAREYGRPADE